MIRSALKGRTIQEATIVTNFFYVKKIGCDSYVQDISSYDGDTDWTDRIEFARLFSGEGWKEIWGDETRFELIYMPDGQK